MLAEDYKRQQNRPKNGGRWEWGGGRVDQDRGSAVELIVDEDAGRD